MLRTEYAVDTALAGSFPASDPAPWTPGLARPAPPRRTGSEVSPLEALAAVAGAGGLVMLLPFVILAIGTPIALAVRALLEIVQWVFPAMR